MRALNMMENLVLLNVDVEGFERSELFAFDIGGGELNLLW